HRTAFRCRPRLASPWAAPLDSGLLPARDRLASAPRDYLPGRGAAIVALHRLSPCRGPIAQHSAGVVGTVAVGTADDAAVRGRGLDRLAAHADARHSWDVGEKIGGIDDDSSPQSPRLSPASSHRPVSIALSGGGGWGRRPYLGTEGKLSDHCVHDADSST